MMEDQLMIFWRRGETSLNFFSFVIITLPRIFFLLLYHVFWNFVTILSILGEYQRDRMGPLTRGDNEASAKYVYLCYNEENIKNGEKTCQSKITNQILRWKQPMISPLQT